LFNSIIKNDRQLLSLPPLTYSVFVSHSIYLKLFEMNSIFFLFLVIPDARVIVFNEFFLSKSITGFSSSGEAA